MNIKMAGIDHSRATIEYREKFSLTASKAEALGRTIRSYEGVDGCVILSTCNRTELWLSGSTPKNALEILCEAIGVDEAAYRTYFSIREGREAVYYLYELASGLRSQIFGEDQILTQVKTALTNSRAGGYTDTVLEILFRDAVTAAKKVKTTTRISPTDSSIPSRAVRILEEKYGSLRGKRCMVIGNGEMGRLSTRLLVDRGCEVCMTLRQYKKKDAIIPAGCHVIDYDSRVERLPEMDIVISATLSPHYTLNYADVQNGMTGKSCVLMDLAVPRDIDPQIATLPNVELYDVDKLGVPGDIFNNNEVDAARALLREKAAEFEQWYYFKEWIPVIQRIGRISGKEAAGKMIKPLKGLRVSPEDAQSIEEWAGSACNKVMTSLLYGLRENLDAALWEQCLSALRQSADDMKAKSEG